MHERHSDLYHEIVELCSALAQAVHSVLRYAKDITGLATVSIHERYASKASRVKNMLTVIHALEVQFLDRAD